MFIYLHPYLNKPLLAFDLQKLIIEKFSRRSAPLLRCSRLPRRQRMATKTRHVTKEWTSIANYRSKFTTRGNTDSGEGQSGLRASTLNLKLQYIVCRAISLIKLYRTMFNILLLSCSCSFYPKCFCGGIVGASKVSSIYQL